MARRITIMGMGKSGLKQAENMDRSCAGTEVWGLNNGFLQYETAVSLGLFTRWYEIHTLTYLDAWAKEHHGGMLNYVRELNAIGVPVYRTEALPAIAQQEQFPELAMVKHFGCNTWDGTPSRILAHALYEHDTGQPIEYLQSFGIDMLDHQHAPQKPYWAFWIAQAKHRGIELGGTLEGLFDVPESDVGTRAIRDHIAQMLIDENNAQQEGGA